MTVIAINGSPRKDWNTATLLARTLEGAAAAGAQTELVHLYDLDFKGCRSCFACKIVGGSSEGKCAARDDLSPFLASIAEEAEAIILGTPIYFGSMSGEMRSFMERLLFAPYAYSNPARSLFPRKIRAAIIYTMNASEEMSVTRGYPPIFEFTENYLRLVFGEAETLCSYDTLQFPDYGKVVMETMDAAAKLARREQVFPQDCQRAFELGRRIASRD